MIMSGNLISIQDFSKEEKLHVLEVAKEFETNREQNFLAGKVIACLFFEPSTRTRLSFEAAVNRLGARVIGFPDAKNTSVSKGETLEDTIRIVSGYVDMIVMRHPMEGAAEIAANVASVPVVNAGDGANQHPTQTLLDMYSILKTQGRLDNLDINMVGDLRYGRTVHSLSEAMSDFNPHYTFISPAELKMPQKYLDFLDSKGIKFDTDQSLQENLNNCDILYMTRSRSARWRERASRHRAHRRAPHRASRKGQAHSCSRIGSSLRAAHGTRRCARPRSRARYPQCALGRAAPRGCLPSSHDR